MLDLRRFGILVLCTSVAIGLSACGGDDGGGGGGGGGGADATDDTGGGGGDGGGGGSDATDDGGGGTCAPGQTTCSRNIECEIGEICSDDGCCVPVPDDTTCTEHLQECESAEDSTDEFLCDTDTFQCLQLCNAAAADQNESSDCPPNSWCFELTGEPANPALNGACIPGDCTNIFESEEQCDDGTCLPLGNGASFCLAAGDAAAGDDCFIEDVAEGENRPASDVCEPGLVCRANVCTEPCNRDNGDDDCAEGEECVAALDSTRNNRPGICGVECDEFSTGQCAEGEVCSPTLGRAGVNVWMCAEAPEEQADFGEPCDPEDNIGCVEGAICFNTGTDDDGNDLFECGQICDPAGESSGDTATCLGREEGMMAFGATEFSETSDTLELEIGDHEIDIRMDASDALIATADIEVEAGSIQNAIIWDTNADEDGGISVATLENTGGTVTTGFRGLHAASTAGDVDVYRGWGFATELEMNSWSPWMAFDAGSYNLVVALFEMEMVGAFADGITLEDGNTYTAFATGDADEDVDTIDFGVVGAPIPTLGDDEAGLRFLHAAEGAGDVDIYAGCATADACTEDERLYDDIAFGDSTILEAWIQVASGEMNAYIFASDANPAAVDPVMELTPTFEAGTSYTIVAYLDADDELAISMITDSFPGGEDAASVTALHYAKNVGVVDASLEGTTPIVEDLAPGDAFGGEGDEPYMALDPGTYSVQLRSAGAEADTEPAYASGNWSIAADMLVTTVLTERADGAEGFEGNSILDDLTPPAEGFGLVTFFHAVPGAGEVYGEFPGAANEVCSPLNIEGLGSCSESCEPFPREGDGGYGCESETASCRPFHPSDSEAVDPVGTCVDLGGDLEPFDSCESDFTFGECEDFGLCADLDFDMTEDPECKPLCEPLSGAEGCPGDSVCGALLTIFDPAFGLCESDFIDATIGETCPAERQQFPCADGTICLDLGDGSGASCWGICRSGFDDCPETHNCQTSVFDPDLIPSFMGICVPR